METIAHKEKININNKIKFDAKGNPEKYARRQVFEETCYDNLPEPLFLTLQNLKKQGYNPS